MTEHLFKGKHDAVIAAITQAGNYKIGYEEVEVPGKGMQWEPREAMPVSQMAKALEKASDQQPRAAASARPGDQGTSLSPNVVFQNMAIVAEYCIKSTADIMVAMVNNGMKFEKPEHAEALAQNLTSSFMAASSDFMSNEIVMHTNLIPAGVPADDKPA